MTTPAQGRFHIRSLVERAGEWRAVWNGFVQPISWAVDLILPPECVWCLAPVSNERTLCEECESVLTREESCCQRCSMPVPAVVDRSACIRCRNEGWRFDRVIALGPYRGKLREAIIMMKKPTFESLTVAAGTILGQRLIDQQVVPDLILPVPNHWSRRLAHRTSSAETLATAIGRLMQRPLSLHAVQRVKRTRKQGMLAWSNRPSNVHRAFHVRRPQSIAGQHVLIVDDVFTSGATAAELTRCLLKAGAKKVTIAVAARGTGTRQ